MVDAKRVIRDYERIKGIARRLYDADRIDDCVKAIHAASWIAYHFCFRYRDPDLDGLLGRISEEKAARRAPIRPRSGAYMLYDSFALDNRGLTQQYIRALTSWGVEFAYVMDYGTSDAAAKEILRELAGYPKAKVVRLPARERAIDRIDGIKEAIAQYAPERAFLHIAPWSAEAISAWSGISGVERFLIDITDHAFWLGAGALDYCIEFRDFGCKLAVEERGIPRDRVLKQLYYPILDDARDFLGFPIDTTGKTVFLSGGRYEKIFGADDAFFKSISRIMAENEGSVLFFAGDGNRKSFEEKLIKHGLQGRMIPLGNRPDIDAVMRRSDIYLGTYPQGGALMSQIACACETAMVSLYNPDYPFGNPESVLKDQKSSIGVVFTDHEAFYREVRKLVANKGYRSERASALSRSVLTKGEFDEGLWALVDAKIPATYDDRLDLKLGKESELFLDMENDSIKAYPALLRRMISIKDRRAFVFNIHRNWRVLASKVIRIAGEMVGSLRK